MTGRPVVLLGLMGAGKTSVGRRVAAALARPFWDSDEKLTARYGATAAEQHRTVGEAVLHAREAALLREAVAARPAPVVAAAASVVEDPGTVAALAQAYVVWLNAPPEVLASRVAASAADHRPRFRTDLVAQFQEQYDRRGARLRQLADLVVDVSRRRPPQVAATVLAAVRRTP
ncbi:MAG TPA: shikimate kinase [Natronosporangium sp.]|nr:shikimate kinase [Natronosporangium sp.]